MILRLTFGGLVAIKTPPAEIVVFASVAGLLANLVLFYWKKDLSRPSQRPESPWNRKFIHFLGVAAVCVIGGYCFTQGDLLPAERCFPGSVRDAYSAAGLLARALPVTVASLLTILCTHRSGETRHE